MRAHTHTRKINTKYTQSEFISFHCQRHSTGITKSRVAPVRTQKLTPTYSKSTNITELIVNSHSDAGTRNREMLSAERPSRAPATTPTAGRGFLAKKLICSRSWSLVTSFDPLNTYVFGNAPNPNS